FRVWQIFDAMVGFSVDGDAPRFVCAAGVLTHYIGDACQPLHISYLHDGDPERKYEYTFAKGKHEGESVYKALGNGVHSAYEDEMIDAFREKVFAALDDTPKVKSTELIKTGREAAALTIYLMRRTFGKLAPADLVQAFIDYDGAKKNRPNY